jgi:hypothetical protein
LIKKTCSGIPVKDICSVDRTKNYNRKILSRQFCRLIETKMLDKKDKDKPPPIAVPFPVRALLIILFKKVVWFGT